MMDAHSYRSGGIFDLLNYVINRPKFKDLSVTLRFSREDDCTMDRYSYRRKGIFEPVKLCN